MSSGEYIGPAWAYGLTAKHDTDPDGRTVTVWMDSAGNEVKRIRWPRPTSATGIPIDQRVDPTAYHREYYRRVRRIRDKRKSLKHGAESHPASSG